MLYIACMIILSDHSIRKIICENFDFWATQGEKLHEQVVYPSPGSPPPPPPPPGPNTQIRWKTCKYGLKYALHSLSGHFEWSQYQKNKFGNFDFWAAQGENCISRLCTNPLGDTPPRTTNTRIGWKTRKYGLKHALHSLYDHFKWSQYQKNNLRKLRFLSYSGWKTAWAGCVPIPWEPPPPPPRPDLIPK